MEIDYNLKKLAKFFLRFLENSIQFNFYFSHVLRDSIQYIRNNKHLYYHGRIKKN